MDFQKFKSEPPNHAFILTFDPLINVVAMWCFLIIKPLNIALAISTFLFNMIQMYMDKTTICIIVKMSVQQIIISFD
jgi:hypothetical protein